MKRWLINIRIRVKNRLASILPGLGYLQKWVPIAAVIGIVSGLGAIIFQDSTAFVSQILLGQVAGYLAPTPAGEGGLASQLSPRSYIIPIVTTLGGLLSGIIVFGLAPEAEGHGTDAAIDAFHNKKGEIRSRIPLVKLIASALTIGSGGSAGREGPTAQIGAGFGSLLSKMMGLSVHERRISLVVGIAAGIGSIFKAPFGGALLAAEILYTSDFEGTVIIPAFIASTVGYSIFASVKGWAPVFGLANQYTFNDPSTLLLFAFLGISCGLVGIGYIRAFYDIRDVFQRLPIPNYIKPAIGGFIVGVIGMFLPQVLGVGYGWLQLIMNGSIALPLTTVLIIVIGKILATSLSIGSGGSGGVFAPALVIGGLLGAAVWSLFNAFLPGFYLNPAPFVIVGMMSFFGGVGKVPVAVMLMISEMTGTLTLLVPSMIATSIAYVITGRNTIYRSQVATRAESPAHRGEFSMPLLQRLIVKDAMTKRVIKVESNAFVSEVAEIMAKNGINGMPVVEKNGVLIGLITVTDVLHVPAEYRNQRTVGEVMAKNLIVTYPDESLYTVFQKMTANEIGRLPVLDRNTGKLTGIITRGDVARAYNVEVQSIS